MRYHIQRYMGIKIPAAGAGDFPITVGQLQDPTLVTQPPAIRPPAPGLTWQGAFPKEYAIENLALWISTPAAVNWKVQINGTDNAVAVATTAVNIPKSVFTLAGPYPPFDMVFNCNIANAGAAAVTLSVWWVGLIRSSGFSI